MSNEDQNNVVEAQEVQQETTPEAVEEKTPEQSHRDENWELVTFLNFTWDDANKVDGDDRAYLLSKAEEVKLEVLRRRKLEMEEVERRKQAQEQQQQMLMQQQQGYPPTPQTQQPQQPWQGGPPNWQQQPQQPQQPQ
tara:strand:- start:1391 stop:1801 length:411 start_codon:yes stop_codon:yes gene_type:complete